MYFKALYFVVLHTTNGRISVDLRQTVSLSGQTVVLNVSVDQNSKITQKSSTDTCKSQTTDNKAMEENDDPLNQYRQATSETCLQSLSPDYPVTVEQNNGRCSLGNEVYNIAPGENRHPVSIMTDKKCEELAFPVLFPKGQFGYTEERKIKLSPVKYFNARLLHYNGRFATNPEYFSLHNLSLNKRCLIA